MRDNKKAKITIKRIIPAQKERVIRLATKVWEFPTYMPCVKEVSVIRRDHHKIKTKWRIQINKVPINWVEEDSLILKKDSIRFQMVEGDLEEFFGEWKFKDTPEGTEVTIDACVKVNIPAIKDFVQPYICLLYTSPSPRDLSTSRMPSSA